MQPETPKELCWAHFAGTLAGNALSMAAMRATLEHVLTEEAFRLVRGSM